MCKAKVAVIRSAVVPGLSLFSESRRFSSNFTNVFLPFSVFKPPSFRTCFAWLVISLAFASPVFRAISVSGILDSIFRKVCTTALFMLFSVSTSFFKKG